MAFFDLKHGTRMSVLTPEEARDLFDEYSKMEEVISRVRASAVVTLDAQGNGRDDVYAVPVGGEFAARRVVLDLSTATDPSTGNVALNVAGKSVEYLRSGVRIEYGVPFSPNAVSQVPGIQTWGSEQGPYLRNGEVFQVRATGLTPNATLEVTVEGILRKRDKAGK